MTSKRPAKDPWQEVRRAVFSPRKVRTAEGVRNLPAYAAYFESLSRAAVQGDLSATREQNHLLRHIDENQKLIELRRQPPSPLDLKIQEHEEQYLFLRKFASIAHAWIIRQLKRGYKEKHGCSFVGEFEVPDIVDEEMSRNYEKRMDREPRKQPAAEYQVGYGKPPLNTRWRKHQSGNPSGRPRETPAEWDAFRAGLLRSIRVLKCDQETVRSSIYIAVSRLFDLAIQGRKEARREVRRVLIELDQRGLLKPPPQQRRRQHLKSLPLSGSQRYVIKCELRQMRLFLLGEMRKSCEIVYGYEEDFFEDLERQRQEISQSPRLRRIMERDANAPPKK